MKKDTIRGIIGFGVLLILYILVVFLIPFVKTAVFWVSFVFTLIAFGVVAAAFFFAFGKNPDAKSRFYGYPIARISVIYGGVQLVVGLLLMVLGQWEWVPMWLAVLIYAFILGAAVIGLLSADTVADQIREQDKKLKKDVTLMRSLQSKLNQLASDCDDPAVKKLAEDVRYSDPVSGDALWEAENELSAAVDELQTAVIDGDTAAIAPLCRKATALLAERNRLCKLNKQ